MTGEEFLKKILEPSTKKVGTEVPYGMMSTLKRYMNHDPYAPQGMFEGQKISLFNFFLNSTLFLILHLKCLYFRKWNLLFK